MGSRITDAQLLGALDEHHRRFLGTIVNQKEGPAHPPVSSYAPTVAYKVTDVRTLTTTSNGSLFFMVTDTLDCHFLEGKFSDVAGEETLLMYGDPLLNGTGEGAEHNDANALAGELGSYSTVGMAVDVSYLGSDQDFSGEVTTTVAEANTFAGQYATSYQDGPWNNFDVLEIASHPRSDSVRSKELSLQAASHASRWTNYCTTELGTNAASNWAHKDRIETAGAIVTALYVVVTGAPPNTDFSVKTTLNLFGFPLHVSLHDGTARHSHKSSLVGDVAANVITAANSATGMHTLNMRHLTGKAKTSVLGGALRAALPFVDMLYPGAGALGRQAIQLANDVDKVRRRKKKKKHKNKG